MPFLDHEFVEFSTRVPQHMKLRNGEGKYIVKKAVEDLLPARNHLPQENGISDAARANGCATRAPARLFAIMRARDGLLASYFDPAALEQLLAPPGSGREDATDRIWRLLNLQILGRHVPHGQARGTLGWVMAAARRRR